MNDAGQLQKLNGKKTHAPIIVPTRTMSFRILFLCFLITGLVTAHASDPIAAPADGASATVTQPHETAELIPERTSIEPGKPFDVILHLHSDPGWHTYWINPGDAGLATTIAWTLPPGFTAGPIQWPTPEKHDMGGLMTYGYAGDVYLLTTITPPKGDLPQHFDLKAKAQWLVCQEECIPGKAELTVTLDTGLLNLRLPKENTELFAQARERLPVPATNWKVSAEIRGDYLTLRLETPDFVHLPTRFFPEQANVLSNLDADNPSAGALGKPVSDGRTMISTLPIKLQQNGDKPDKLSGVLVSDQPLIGNAKAVYIASFPIASAPNSEVAAAGPAAGADVSA